MKLNKYPPQAEALGMPESTFNSTDAELHRKRRAAIAPFFSKRSIMKLEPLIKEKVEKACERLSEFKARKEVLDLRLLCAAMTTDIITTYSYPHCFDMLDDPELCPAWRSTFEAGLENYHIMKHYTIMWTLIRILPSKILHMLQPNLELLANIEKRNEEQIKEIMRTFSEKNVETDNPTIFHELLSSDLPPQEKSYTRLLDEGKMVMAAGVETTANALCVIVFHILSNPAALVRLRQELTTAMPNANELLSWSQLETLPYLSAVISEGLRLAIGVTSRIIRMAPPQGLQYGEYHLPEGTGISMSTLLLNQDPKVFHDPFSFIPERWLKGEGDKDRSDLLVFSKGPRMCMGIK
jgi:cytochrome P450